ncbi:MAG: hypothetical protein PHF00_07270 [Elusimicrobia bacterium]|nr:hypothetical protein [Elusimicrobiota bacterium]
MEFDSQGVHSGDFRPSAVSIVNDGREIFDRLNLTRIRTTEIIASKPSDEVPYLRWMYAHKNKFYFILKSDITLHDVRLALEDTLSREPGLAVGSWLSQPALREQAYAWLAKQEVRSGGSVLVTFDRFPTERNPTAYNPGEDSFAVSIKDKRVTLRELRAAP